MRRVGELSPADWPRVFHGVRWDRRGRGRIIAAGGKVTQRVRLIDGVIARVPARSVRAVRRARGVRSVVVDRAFKTRSDDDDADALLGESTPASEDVPADATT